VQVSLGVSEIVHKYMVWDFGITENPEMCYLRINKMKFSSMMHLKTWTRVSYLMYKIIIFA